MRWRMSWASWRALTISSAAPDTSSARLAVVNSRPTKVRSAQKWRNPAIQCKSFSSVVL